MIDIKPCPFCGSDAEYWLDRQYSDCHVIECENCGCSRRSEDNLRVYGDWNDRYDVNKIKEGANKYFDSLASGALKEEYKIKGSTMREVILKIIEEK